MDDIAIQVNQVSMKFNMANENITSLKEYIIKMFQRKLFYKEFWALKDISFELKKGEILGIVGLNGAGKSTLLKIVSGVFKPTEGQVRIAGSIAPLIELGAGFDPELTAKENVYLNGAILGYDKKYIDSKYDEIIQFAELEEFQDVAIKNFSSGMYARLGFAVATIVEPEILIVDEILSVGDYKFQEKCQKKIQYLFDKGVTVVLVSHSIEQISQLCTKVMWLDHGRLKLIGRTEEVCRTYIE